LQYDQPEFARLRNGVARSQVHEAVSVGKVGLPAPSANDLRNMQRVSRSQTEKQVSRDDERISSAEERLHNKVMNSIIRRYKPTA